MASGDIPGTAESRIRHPEWASNTDVGTNIFNQMFRQGVGRDPTPDELNRYLTTVLYPKLAAHQGAWSSDDLRGFSNDYISNNLDVERLREANVTPPPPVSTSTPEVPQGPELPTGIPSSTDISAFIPAVSNQQENVVNQAIQQSRGVADTNVADLSKLLQDNILAQMTNWTDPNSPDYQATMGQLNNVGRADANTFGQSLSSRLAPLMSESMTQLGQGALLPSFQNQQNLVSGGAATQSQLGLAPLQRFIDLQNFQKQSALANQLADKGQPSNMQQGIGMGSSILQGLGQFGQGISGLKQLTEGCFLSTACTEAMGLPDTCDDLTILRSFRDGYVKNLPNGQNEIKSYYEIAPRIVKAVNGLSNRASIYRAIYKALVKSCVSMILRGSPREAFDHYKNRTLELKRRFL